MTTEPIHTHRWTFSHPVNMRYAGTALVSCDAVMVCHDCGAWKVVAQSIDG